METPLPSPRLARLVLISVYLAWLMALACLANTAATWAGTFAGVLLILIWLPFDVYRKRHEWLTWLPLHLTVLIGTVIFAHLMGRDEPRTWFRPATAVLAAVFAALQAGVDGVLQRRAERQRHAFLTKRAVAPRHKPVMRYAGRPKNRH